MRYDSVIDAIGHTPLVRLRLPAAPAVEIYAKLELQNLFAMKDRVAKQAILDARERGLLAPGAPIVESSSGTMALGLALVGTYLGHDVHIVTDPRIDPITLGKLRALGCFVHVVEAKTSQGWQSARLERLSRLMAELDGALWPRQYSNPHNPLAYKALAAELRADLNEFDGLVGAVGSGGSMCGTTRALRPHLPGLRAVAVDCVGSVLFAQPDWSARRQSGLGNSLHPENLDHALIDEVHWLNDAEAFAATRDLAREQKIFAGNTSGSVYRVLCHLASAAPAGTRIVGIFPDRGDRYVDSVYGDGAEHTPVATVPRPVRYGTTVSRWSYAVLPRSRRPRLIFVESNTTGTGMLALRVAARLGHEPVFLTGSPARYAGLAETRAKVVECDTNDWTALEGAVAREAAAAPLGGIATTSEFYLVPVADLAARFGVPGNPPEAMATCRDKARTRAALDAAGVAQPAYAVVRRAGDVAAAVARVGLPCVVKPVDDSGSNDVLLCRSVAEAHAHAGRILAVPTNVRGQSGAGAALIEAYVDAPELSVEMFSLGGRVSRVGITRKFLTGLPHFVECQHIFPADLPDRTAGEVAEAARRALDATDVTLGTTHVEVKLAEGGPIVVEINARLAGGMIPELIRLATGLDLVEQQLRAAVGLPVTLTAPRLRHAGIRFLLADRAGRLAAVTGVDRARRVAGVERVVVTATQGAAVRPPANAYDRLGYIVAVGASSGEVERALGSAACHVEVVVDEGAGEVSSA